MYTLTDTDKIDLSHGFDKGNYASAYETEDYDVAKQAIDDMSIYYRIGYLLGFFSSYELHEISETWRAEVELYRKADLI